MSILKQCGQEATLLIEFDVSIMGKAMQLTCESDMRLARMCFGWIPEFLA